MTSDQAAMLILSFALGAFGIIFGFYQTLKAKDLQTDLSRMRDLASYNLKRSK